MVRDFASTASTSSGVASTPAWAHRWPRRPVASVHPSIRRKLGQWRDSELRGIQVNYDSDGTSIWMSYETK